VSGGEQLRVASLLIALAATPAWAHSIVVYSGRIEWLDEKLQIEIQLEPHLVEHERRGFGRRLQSEQLARALAKTIHVHADSGRQLAPPQVRMKSDGTAATFIFDTRVDTETLAIVHRAEGPLATLRRQFQLRWWPFNTAVARLVRLTSGGNHAVIERDSRPDAFQTLVDRFTEPVFRIVPDRPNGNVRLIIDFPCTLLATWSGLAPQKDVITGDWVRARRDRLKDWLTSSLMIAHPSGDTLPGQLERIGMIRPNDEFLDDADVSVSIYTIRVRMIVMLAQPSDQSRYDVTWRAFNPAVLRIPVITEGGSPALIGELTPTQAVIRIDDTYPIRATLAATSAE
jgi:hypothetical protein